MISSEGLGTQGHVAHHFRQDTNCANPHGSHIILPCWNCCSRRAVLVSLGVGLHSKQTHQPQQIETTNLGCISSQQPALPTEVENFAHISSGSGGFHHCQKIQSTLINQLAQHSGLHPVLKSICEQHHGKSWPNRPQNLRQLNLICQVWSCKA